MARYILLSSLTTQGRETMHKNPDRLTAVNKEVEGFRLQDYRSVRRPGRL